MRSIRVSSPTALRYKRRSGGRRTGKALVCLLAVAGLLGPLFATPAQADDPRLSGGAATVFATGINAYSRPVPALDSIERALFYDGRRLFFAGWELDARDAEIAGRLGPTFNRERCSGCHLRNGRGWPPVFPDEEIYAMLIRLSVPGTDAVGGPKPHPVYGAQLQNHSVPGVPAEGHPYVRGHEIEGRYPDGWAYKLFVPDYVISDLAFGEFGPDTMMSVRVALPIIGLGLLDAVPLETVYALADPRDLDGDGISGRINIVWDVESNAPAVGRYGWKAGVPSIRQQSAAAALIDMGVTNRLYPVESCGRGQDQCAAARDGGVLELSDAMLDALTFYASTLAVPARRGVDDPRVQRGEQLFHDIGCAACHIPTLVTGDDAVSPALAGQVIHPYTDLLLHDMGEGLSDHRPEFLATGREWRTPPLWAIGLLSTVTKRQFLLHDGRARGFAEAILWHGGEAQTARDAFHQLPAADRSALTAFLERL